MKVDKTKLHLIATGDATSNWDYYLASPCADGSQTVLFIAREGSGASDGIFCGVSRLRAHLIHLANVRYGNKWRSAIPDDWNVVDNAFFDKHGIY